MQFQIAVCDDEARDRERIVQMTEDLLQSERIPYSIISFASGRELLSAIQGGDRFHLLLLDVMMEEMDGMELAAAIREQQNRTSIVFISTNREMALRGYEVSAARYLAKPVEEEKLQEALIYCHNVWLEKREILLSSTKGQCRIRFSEIQYVEAFERGTRIVLVIEAIETKLK